MRWIIGKGIGVPFRMGGGQSWSSYWSHQPEVLFFGLYSEISGGQMPNKVPGATDYLTVTGAAGSETYQCPNTAAYIAADTDYIWFTSTEDQRTVTTAELIGYDLPRTIVKYGNISPNTIEAIMILSSDVDTAKMRDDFDLSVWWNNVLSSHGNIKDNRGSQQSIWPKYTKLLSHFDGDDGAVASNDEIAGAWIFSGNAQIDTAQKKFGTASLLCSAVTDYVSLLDSVNYKFGIGDFTIDFQFRPQQFILSKNNFICGQSDASATASSRQSNIFITTPQLNSRLNMAFYDNAGKQLTTNIIGTPTTLLINTWYHIAIIRYGNTITGYLDGVAQCSVDVTGITLQDSSEKFVVGRLGDYDVANQSAKGWIDEFRLSKGIARWTETFTPPTEVYTID